MSGIAKNLSLSDSSAGCACKCHVTPFHVKTCSCGWSLHLIYTAATATHRLFRHFPLSLSKPKTPAESVRRAPHTTPPTRLHPKPSPRAKTGLLRPASCRLRRTLVGGARTRRRAPRPHPPGQRRLTQNYVKSLSSPAALAPLPEESSVEVVGPAGSEGTSTCGSSSRLEYLAGSSFFLVRMAS